MATPLEANTLTTTGSGVRQPLRVLSVIPDSADGAPMVFAERQVASLERIGVSSHVFHMAPRSSPAVLFKEWRRLRREIEWFRPHLVHTHFGTMTGFLCAMATTLPLVVTYRGSDLNPTPNLSRPRSIVGKCMSQIVALRAARIICVTEQLKARLWWRRERVSIILTGVNTTLFAPCPKEQARSTLGWEQEERIVLFNAGGRPKYKRLDLAQSTMDIVTSRCGKVRFVVMNGDVEPAMVPQYMNGADCLLVTSNWEGSPNVVKEALACNLPIVTVDVGDVRERLRGVYPSVVESRDPHALAKGVCTVLGTNQRSNGASTLSDITEQVVAQRILAVYKGAARDWKK
jgi:teichuronic acid biosynthesis glycosyltransferase TuaC